MTEGRVVFPMTNEDLFAIRSTVLYLALGCGTKAKANHTPGTQTDRNSLFRLANTKWHFQKGMADCRRLSHLNMFSMATSVKSLNDARASRDKSGGENPHVNA